MLPNWNRAEIFIRVEGRPDFPSVVEKSDCQVTPADWNARC